MISRLLLFTLITPLCAGEVTVEKGSFKIEHQFTATAIPTEPILISLDAESWKNFTIEKILDHGSSVKKGDVLISFEREAYERKLTDHRRHIDKKTLELEIAELELVKLKSETKLKLATARRKKERASDELKYFQTVSQLAQKEDLKQSQLRSEFSLESTKEELAQLQQMYEEDDLTEQTEEIILKRQKVSVARAEYSLAAVKRRNARTLSTSIPRKLEDLKHDLAQVEVTLKKEEAILPRLITSAEIDITGKKIALERDLQELERLVQDGKLLQIIATTDGVFFYGSFEDNRWKLGDLVKSLTIGGKLPVNRVIASISPVDAQLPLTSHVDYALGRELRDGLDVLIHLNGPKNLKLPGKISNPVSAPDKNGKDSLTVSLTWPTDYNITATEKLTCRSVVYEANDSISIPAKALQVSADGTWKVKIKSDEGILHQAVERGRSSKGYVEILKGLEVGQTIIVPK